MDVLQSLTILMEMMTTLHFPFEKCAYHLSKTILGARVFFGMKLATTMSLFLMYQNLICQLMCYNLICPKRNQCVSKILAKIALKKIDKICKKTWYDWNSTMVVMLLVNVLVSHSAHYCVTCYFLLSFHVLWLELQS